MAGARNVHNQTATNLLFYDGHAVTASTADLPGGIGDANAPTKVFADKSLVDKYPEYRWRHDQN